MEAQGTIAGSHGPGTVVMSPDSFRVFYRAHLPDVYGYLLRLCAGDRTHAEDLTQDVWFSLVEELQRGRTERADVRWLITVARHKFIDAARREQRWRSKLELIHRDETTADQGTGTEPDGSEVLDCLADLQPLHRAVLVLRYVDGLSVPEVAAAIGRDVTPTNSLLARARAELRSASGGNPDA